MASSIGRSAIPCIWRAATTSVAGIHLNQIRPLTAHPHVPAHMACSHTSDVPERSEFKLNLKMSSSGIQSSASQLQTAQPRANGLVLQPHLGSSPASSLACKSTKHLPMSCLSLVLKMSLTSEPAMGLTIAQSTKAIPLGSAAWSSHKQQAPAYLQARAHQRMHSASGMQKAGVSQALLNGTSSVQGSRLGLVLTLPLNILPHVHICV